jgi:translation initiation factor IF-2
VLVKRGTLKPGDPILAGQEFGRVRVMFDEAGKPVDEAGPSIPVQVLGLSARRTPATTCSSSRASARRARSRCTARASSATSSSRRGQDGGGRVLVDGRAEGADDPDVIKADVQGSGEALRDALSKLGDRRGGVKVIASGVGGITESDVMLAAASNARIIGFNVRADATARNAIKDQNVDLRYYSIIYEAIDDVKQALSGLLARRSSEQIVGIAQVREVFRSSKMGQVAGCLVMEGYVRGTTRSACSARTSWSTRARSSRCAASRTTSARCAPAPSAASR